MSEATDAPMDVVLPYLNLCKTSVTLLAQRQGLYRDSCPIHAVSEDSSDQQKTIDAINQIDVEIHETCGSIRQYENKHLIGASQLIGTTELMEQDELLLATITVILSRLYEPLGRECRDIASLMTFVCGPSSSSLIVRDAFRTGGCLRPYVRVDGIGAIDEMRIVAHETALCAFLGRKPTTEEAAMAVLYAERSFTTQRRLM